MDVKTIVSNYLKANSFEGLFSDGECACELSDLMPCCEDCSACEPGFKVSCPEECGDHEFHITSKTPINT
jgi:hypothetical protein